MGAFETLANAAAMDHQREAKDAAGRTISLLDQLLAEQQQTNRLLLAMMTPEAVERLRAADEVREAEEAAATPEKKRRWRG